MSGYLQRLAISVARPRPSLHPLVGSIFSGERQESAPPALIQNDASAFTDDQNLVPITRTVSHSPDDPPRRRDPAADDRVEQRAGIALPTDDRRTEQRRSDPETFRPLLPPKTTEVGVPEMLRETAPGDVASAQSASSIVNAARTTHAAAEDGPTADRQNAIAPLPVGGWRESAGMLAGAAGDTGKTARAEFSAPSRQSAPSDDIQIHIGRIEVTAIAQPTPRPATPPARKGMSLDEYLGRRSRGTR
jgi:hypothetical protein